jgi:hypothetical protein
MAKWLNFLDDILVEIPDAIAPICGGSSAGAVSCTKKQIHLLSNNGVPPSQVPPEFESTWERENFINEAKAKAMRFKERFPDKYIFSGGSVGPCTKGSVELCNEYSLSWFLWQCEVKWLC